MTKGRSSSYGISVAVVYPGTRPEGMASLALHALIDQIGRHPNATAERIFTDDRKQSRPKSLETGRMAQDFDLLAFTVCYEEQWVLLPDLLRRAGIPARAADRHDAHPVILAGGMAARLNPRPVLPFVDLLVPGEAECAMPAILECLEAGRGKPRDSLLEDLSGLPGVISGRGGVQPVRAGLVERCRPVVQVIDDSESVFANLHLVETGRGCPAGCRFCAVAFTRRPPLFFGPEEIVAAAQEGISAGKRIGLVGASLARHPNLIEIVEGLSAAGADLSPASLHTGIMAGPHGEWLLSRLYASGQRSLTLAPETGSVRLGKLINKPYSEEVFERAVRRMGQAGIMHLKLYLMYGLPGEEEEDLEDTIELVAQAHDWLVASQRPSGKVGRLTVSLNPFVPKPHTPLGLEPMPPVTELKRKFARLAGGMRKAGAQTVSGLSPRHAVLQALLGRASEELSDLIEKTGGRWPPATGLLSKMVPDLGSLVHNPWPKNETPPWNLVDVGVKSTAIVTELQRAKSHVATEACAADQCESCGACEGIEA